MKKIFSLTLSLLMALTMTTYASATGAYFEEQLDEPVLLNSVSINEYDMYVASQADSNVLARGSITAEAALLERAQLPEKTLISYGYTDDEISILKAYDGSSIDENPQLKGLFADLSVRLYRMAYDSHGVTVRFFWNWETPPVLHSFVTIDNISCAWVGVGTDNKPHALRFQGKDSVCEVEYFDGDKSVGREKIEIDDEDVNSCVKAAVHMGEMDAFGGWSKRGYMDITLVEPVPTNELSYSTVAFVYGHQTSLSGGSAAFTIHVEGLDISFTPKFGTEEMYNGSISIWTNGYFEFNGDAK